MGRRGRRESFFHAGVSTSAREAIETRWRRRLIYQPQLGALVTAGQTQREPFHRWMSYRQGFSPGLVRLFLRDAEGLGLRRSDRLLLDPFSGSGTFVVECARCKVRALGVEAMASLVFLNSITAEKSMPQLPDLTNCGTWQETADRLEIPIHRAALMYAVGRQHTSAGKLNAGARPLPELLDEVVWMMCADLRAPLSPANVVRQGDARCLGDVDPDSIGGILTSPPYLSRHDYTKVLRPYEMVYEHWYASRGAAQRKADQLAACPGSFTCQKPVGALPAVVEEVCQSLVVGGEGKLAGVVGAYFQGMFDVLAQCARVVCSGGSCWMVIGGARLKGVYVPSDLILADYAATCGFEVQSVLVARNLIGSGRKLGRLTNVAPRESILVLRKS